MARLVLFVSAAAFGFSLSALGIVAAPYFSTTSKIARCVAHHSLVDCHRDWILPVRPASSR